MAEITLKNIAKLILDREDDYLLSNKVANMLGFHLEYCRQLQKDYEVYLKAKKRYKDVIENKCEIVTEKLKDYTIKSLVYKKDTEEHQNKKDDEHDYVYVTRNIAYDTMHDAEILARDDYNRTFQYLMEALGFYITYIRKEK